MRRRPQPASARRMLARHLPLLLPGCGLVTDCRRGRCRVRGGTRFRRSGSPHRSTRFCQRRRDDARAGQHAARQLVESFHVRLPECRCAQRRRLPLQRARSGRGILLLRAWRTHRPRRSAGQIVWPLFHAPARRRVGGGMACLVDTPGASGTRVAVRPRPTATGDRSLRRFVARRAGGDRRRSSPGDDGGVAACQSRTACPPAALASGQRHARQDLELARRQGPANRRLRRLAQRRHAGVAARQRQQRAGHRASGPLAGRSPAAADAARRGLRARSVSSAATRSPRFSSTVVRQATGPLRGRVEARFANTRRLLFAAVASSA
jgi:hypothetical protein